MTSILEPVRDLGQRQPRLFGQCALLVGRRVAIESVAIFESGAGFLFEAVDRFLSVPDRLRQRILPTEPVLVHGSQRPVPHLFGLLCRQNKVPH